MVGERRKVPFSNLSFWIKRPDKTTVFELLDEAHVHERLRVDVLGLGISRRDLLEDEAHPPERRIRHPRQLLRIEIYRRGENRRIFDAGVLARDLHRQFGVVLVQRDRFGVGTDKTLGGIRIVFEIASLGDDANKGKLKPKGCDVCDFFIEETKYSASARRTLDCIRNDPVL